MVSTSSPIELKGRSIVPWLGSTLPRPISIKQENKKENKKGKNNPSRVPYRPPSSPRFTQSLTSRPAPPYIFLCAPSSYPLQSVQVTIASKCLQGQNYKPLPRYFTMMSRLASTLPLLVLSRFRYLLISLPVVLV